MNIFKKALIVALSIGLISIPSAAKEVEAANVIATYYLNIENSTKWSNSKYHAVWQMGKTGGDSFAEAKAVPNKSGWYYYQLTDSKMTGIIFTEHSSKSYSWNNKVYQTQDCNFQWFGDKVSFSLNGSETSNASWDTGRPYDFNVYLDSSKVEKLYNSSYSLDFGKNIIDLSLLDKPSKKGYQFKGWNLDGVVYNEKEKVIIDDLSNHLNVYAEWEEIVNSVDVKYYASEDAKDAYYLESVEIGKNATGPSTNPSSSVDGYSFAGWHTADGNEFSFSTIISESINLYATWEYTGLCNTMFDNRYYYDNSITKWTNVNAYYWDGATVTWPGNAMTNIAGTNLWYIDIDGTPKNIIFNNGSEQTVDLTVSGNIFKCEKKTSGKWNGSWKSLDSNVYFQNKAGSSETTSDIRLIGTLGTSSDDTMFDLNTFNKVGFMITSKEGTKIKFTETASVYTSVNALDGTVDAKDKPFNSDYLFATVFTGVPEGTKITVTPYGLDATGSYYFGSSSTFIIYNA